MNASPDIRDATAPAGPTRPAAESGARAPDAAKPARRHRVLLVDDEENILAALRRLLRRENYELVTAGGPDEALRLLEQKPAQLIISDHRMPGRTGVELLREIRRRWPDSLRIILSGYSEVSSIIAAVNEGEIYKFISKPWNDEEIKLHIRRALEQFDLAAENRRMAQEILTQNERLRELNELLEQRAGDASRGLMSAQDLLETLGVGVLSIDPSGLIVGANRRAHEIITSGKSALMGMPAEVAFPQALRDLVHAGESAGEKGASARLEHAGRRLQCRVNPLMGEGGCRGSVLAIWEEVA